MRRIDLEVLRVVRDGGKFRFDISKDECRQALYNLWWDELISVEFVSDSGGYEPTGVTAAGAAVLESEPEMREQHG